MKSFQEFTEEKKKGTHGKACWTGYRRKGVNDCVKIEEGTTTHTTLSAVKSILPAGHVHTYEESNDETKVKHNDIIVSRNAKHKEHARFRATSETGGGDITLASYTSREPEHVAIAAHEAHHALIHHKLKGKGALHSNEHIVNKMTRKWIDKNYVGNDRVRAHAAISKSAASYKDQLPTQKMQVHRSERAMAENFADGRNPQDKGDMARHGLRGKSISQLKAIRSSSNATPRQKQLAHWYINMHSKE